MSDGSSLRLMRSSRSSSSLGDPAIASSSDELPGIPALYATRLQLELLTQESMMDLSAVSAVILSDVGATLQILRLIGAEFPDSEEQPTRMEDCIATLSIDAWYQAVCAPTFPQHGHIAAVWLHCRRVAQHARALAQPVDGLSPEQAYIVGLLHELGRMPNLLGWGGSPSLVAEHKAVGVLLADYWHLPQYLLTAIREQHEAAQSSASNRILQIAQQKAQQERAADPGSRVD